MARLLRSVLKIEDGRWKKRDIHLVSHQDTPNKLNLNIKEHKGKITLATCAKGARGT